MVSLDCNNFKGSLVSTWLFLVFNVTFILLPPPSFCPHEEDNPLCEVNGVFFMIVVVGAVFLQTCREGDLVLLFFYFNVKWNKTYIVLFIIKAC